MVNFVTLTIDLEDPTGIYAPDGRYVALTHCLLDLCAELNRRATFFCIGRIAQACPDLIKTIAAQGHEIAYHSHNHIPLTEENPARFREQSRDDKNRLEQLAGKTVTGFRAPRFSLTPQSLWAVDVLQELGFVYSSSIMPTSVSLFGFPNAPLVPFRWPKGLIEIPLPVADIKSLRLPYLGGIYLYALPSFIAQYFVTHAARDQMLWTYAHPYDLDRAEKFSLMPNTPAWVSGILWLSRRIAEKKLRHILKLGNAPPLGERVAQLTSLETCS